jgi:hypothetical protein
MDEREKVNNIIKNLKDSSNSELTFALNFLDSDFEQTKTAIIKLTKHIDTVELVYNKVLKELESRK